MLLAQIRNIRKTILPIQMPLTIFKTYESISASPPTCHPRSFVPPPPLYTSQPLSQVRRVELVTALTQGAILTPLWWWHRYSTSSRRAYPKGSQFIMLSRDNIIAQSQHDKPRSLPTNFDKPCCSSSCWSAPPTWSSTTLPWSAHKYSSLIPLLISKPTNFNPTWETISKLSFLLNKC